MSNNIVMFIFGFCATGVLKEIGQFIRAMFNPATSDDKNYRNELLGCDQDKNSGELYGVS